MNNLRIIAIVLLLANVVRPQAQTPLTITNSAGTATGELRMQERRTNGTNYVGIKAPQSIAASLTFTMPGSDGQANDCLQTDGAGQWVFGDCGGERLVSDYNWTQVLGARSGSGAITLTFTGTNCPAAGTDTAYRYRLYETSTPTTYELATSNGTGTCVRGGAGTIVATGPTGTYTNATATSASSGWQEAVFSVADGLPLRLRAAVGGYYVYSDILTEDRYLTAECDGPGALLVPMANNVSVFNAASPGGIRVSHCGFNNAYAKTGTKAIRTYNPDGNSFGSLIYDNNISAFETCVDLQTVYGITGYAYNRHINCTDTALFLSNIETGDAGIGLIGPGNIFSDSVVGGANYGIHWNGPGNLKVVGNSFNGYHEQIRLAPKMGVVDVVGTAVTRVSGPEFRASMVGGGFVASNTVADTVASVTDGTNMVLTSNAVTCTSCIYYVGNTGQMQITGNTMDSWTSTTHNIRAVSDLPFYNFQFDGNFFSNPNTSTYAAGVSVEGAGFYFGSVKHNNLQTSYTVAEAAISLTGGNYIDVANNQIVNHLTGVAIGASAVGATVTNNHCTNNATTTNCVTSAASSTVITQVDSVTYTQLAALSAANSSTLYCSNCKQTSASSATCATGGSGARATRINGAWKCEDGSAVSAYVQGGNSFGATAELGTNDTYGLSLKTNGLEKWSIQTTGHLYAGANNTYDIGAGLSANSPRSVYAATSMVTPKIGRDSSASLTLFTDSADRWTVTSAGMFKPVTADTYDIGDLTTPLRVRGVYSKIIDTALAGGTGDYLQTRKIQLFDNTGSSTGASYWDLNVVMSGVGAGQNSYFYLRDNGGNTVWRADKIASGSPVATTTIYTDLLPDSTANVRDLGKTTQRWDEINGASLDLTGAANITGNLSAAIINATGSPAYRVAGTTVINAARAATFTDLTINTSSAPTVGYVWTATSTGGAGSWQAAAGVTAPLTLTLGAAGYSNPLTVSNSTIGVYGSCVAMAGTDTVGSTVYIAGRMCGRYDSASFTDELVTIQTASGVGAYDVAMTLKNQAVTMPGTLDVTGNISGAVINATGSPAYRVSGTTVINASREATFTGLTIATGAASGYVWTSDASGIGSWQAAGGGWTVSGSDIYRATGIATIGHTSPIVRLGQNFNVNYANDYSGMAINTWSATDTHGGVLDFNKSGSGTIGTHAAVASGETLGFFVFRGSDGSAFQRAVEVNGEVDATVSSGVVPGRIRILTTNTSGVMTERMRIDSAGLASFYAGVDVTGNLSAAVINATGSPAYRVSGTTVIDASRNASFVGLTLNGSITGDLIPATSAVYVIGSSSSLWNNIHADTVTVYTNLIPDASASANLGGSTKRWTKTWTADIDITGTVTPPSGTAFSGTKTVRASGGASDCTLTFSAGIMTGGTC